MEPIKVLIFDDEHGQVVELQFALEQEWEKFVHKNGGRLPPLKVLGVSDRNRILEILRENNLSQKFDFFLCDIFVGAAPKQAGDKIPEADGLRFIKMAKDHEMPICIGITTGDYGSPENVMRQFNKFKNFIDKYYFKPELYGSRDANEPSIVVGEIVEMLRSKGIIRAVGGTVRFDGAKQEARTLGILEEVGEETIGSFADRFALPGATSFELSSIAPGLSGAKILKLTYKGNEEDYSTRPLLIKLSRDRSALEREIDAFCMNIQEPLRSLHRIVAAPYGGNEPLEANGWYGVAFEFAAPSESMVVWLTANPPKGQDQVQKILHELFFGGLSDLYKTTKQATDGIVNLVENGLMSHYRRMAILEAIEVFQPLISKYLGQDNADLSSAKLYLEHGRLKEVEARNLQRRMTQTCIVHGDFHGRNVLVVGPADRNAPRIIDLASMRRSVWATDLVRFLCDIFLSGWDSGTQSYEWTELETWVALVDNFKSAGSSFESAETSDPANRTVGIALDWLKQHTLAIVGLPDEPYHKAEFALCLAVEFLRASYRDRDMPAPKRALGLVAGNILLQEASSLFKR